MARPALTLISAPLLLHASSGRHLVDSIWRGFRQFISGTSEFNALNHAGHPGVNRSLYVGLKNLGYAFNANPAQLTNVAPTVAVLSNVEALEQFILLKREKKITHLLAGPNLVVRATDKKSILGSPEIDGVIVPSTWVAQAYADEVPTLKDKTLIWAAGIDTDYWAPEPQPKRASSKKTALLYWKTEAETFCQLVEKAMKDAGWSVKRFVYGQYTKSEFKKSCSSLVSPYLSAAARARALPSPRPGR